MNILLLIGITIFLGTLAGKIFQKLKIPQVTGYLVVGFLLGKSAFGVLPLEFIDRFSPIMNLALGIIGFLLGSELKFDLFRNRGRSIYSILFAQGILTFLLVTVAVTFFTGKLYLGIFLGVIATATDPASTADVLWENKARGPLTSSLLAIVALDDVLALIIYAFGILIAESLIVQGTFALTHLGDVFVEIGIGAAIGIISGFALYWLTYFIKDKERILPFSLGIITLTVGISFHFKVDLILASMLSGFTLANIDPGESESIGEVVKRFGTPIYVIFFVLVGARLDISLILGSGLILLLFVCIFSRALGKIAGAYLGGILGRAQSAVTRYLGLGLFPQAGVAIGLAMSINNNLSHIGPEAAQIGLTVVNVAVATTFIFQLLGPPFVQLAVLKADEAWKNVTEDDIINAYKVSDLMDANTPVIKEDTSLCSLIESVRESEFYHFCVVDNKERLLGIISLGDLRSTLLEDKEGLNELILAKDIAVPATRFIVADRPLKEAIDLFRSRELAFLPVVANESSKKFVGIMYYRTIMAEIHRRLLKRRGCV